MSKTHKYKVTLDASYKYVNVEETYELGMTDEEIYNYFGEIKDKLTVEDIKELISGGCGECISQELIDVGDPIQDTLIEIREELSGYSNLIYDIGQQQ